MARPLWIARVSFLDGHRWHSFTMDRFEAASLWTAARLAIQGAKRSLTKGTRIEEVSVHLTRIRTTKPGKETT